MHATLSQHTCGGQRALCRSCCLLPPCGVETQVITLGGKHLCTLSHISGPRLTFLFLMVSKVTVTTAVITVLAILGFPDRVLVRTLDWPQMCLSFLRVP